MDQPSWQELAEEVRRLEALNADAIARAGASELAMSRWRAIAGDLLECLNECRAKLETIEVRARAL